jgi:translation initiation factor IF-2
MSRTIHVKPPIIVEELAGRLEISRFQLILDLVGMNVFVRSDQSIKSEVAAFICKQYGFTLVIF